MDNDLISRNHALSIIRTAKDDLVHDYAYAAAEMLDEYIEQMETAPTIDPARHGTWIPAESDYDDDDVLFDNDDWCDWKCSACGGEICYEDPMERRWLPKFCLNCGAKMDGVDDHA